MNLTVTPLSPSFVAEIGGIDLRQSLDQDTVAALSGAIDTFGVLVFHGQRITDDRPTS